MHHPAADPDDVVGGADHGHTARVQQAVASALNVEESRWFERHLDAEYDFLAGPGVDDLAGRRTVGPHRWGDAGLGQPGLRRGGARGGTSAVDADEGTPPASAIARGNEDTEAAEPAEDEPVEAATE